MFCPVFTHRIPPCAIQVLFSVNPVELRSQNGCLGVCRTRSVDNINSHHEWLPLTLSPDKVYGTAVLDLCRLGRDLVRKKRNPVIEDSPDGGVKEGGKYHVARVREPEPGCRILSCMRF